jgi:hypothetical protein
VFRLPAEAIPTPEQVHALIPTRGSGFTATSYPTHGEVLDLISNKAAEIDMELPAGGTLAPEWIAYTRTTIAYGAAADVEAGFFPEQPEDSRVAPLVATYLRMFERLRSRLRGIAPTGNPWAGSL